MLSLSDLLDPVAKRIHDAIIGRVLAHLAVTFGGWNGVEVTPDELRLAVEPKQPAIEKPKRTTKKK